MSKKIESIIVISDKRAVEFMSVVDIYAKEGYEVKCILPENELSKEKKWCEILFQKVNY